MNKITAQQNQSFLDLIVMRYGTLEAAMQAAKVNNVPLSHLPNAGETFDMPDTAGSKQTITYLLQNEVTIGTKGDAELLDLTIVLKPMMTIVPGSSALPHTVGYYTFSHVATSDFINEYPLPDHYLTNNRVHFQTEELYVYAHTYHTATELVATSMAARAIPYQLPLTEGLGYMLVWDPPTGGIPTITFRDTVGHSARVSPFIVLDNMSQDAVAYLIAEIQTEVVARTASGITIRISRKHTTSVIPDFTLYTMHWTEAAAGAMPDPDDPLNEDVRMLMLTAGTYTLGVKTIYNSTYGVDFPTSYFTMVIRVD